MQAGDSTRILWLGLLLWVLPCAALTVGRARGSRLLGAVWRASHLLLLLVLLFPVAREGSNVTGLPSLAALWGPRGLALALVLVAPSGVVALFRALARWRGDEVETPLCSRELLRLEASALRAAGWFGLAPCVVAAIPWLLWLPPEWRSYPQYLSWLTWSACLLLAGGLLEAAARRPVRAPELLNRPLGALLLWAVWALMLAPLFLLQGPSRASRGSLVLAGAIALAAAVVAHWVHTRTRDRLGMPPDEVFGLRRRFRRLLAARGSRAAGTTPTGPDPQPDRPAGPDDAPTCDTPRTDDH